MSDANEIRRRFLLGVFSRPRRIYTCPDWSGDLVVNATSSVVDEIQNMDLSRVENILYVMLTYFFTVNRMFSFLLTAFLFNFSTGMTGDFIRYYMFFYVFFFFSF